MFSPARLHELQESRVPAALCHVVATKGSTPRKPGATMLVIADGTEFGRIEGTIGGGAIEHEVRKKALQVIATMRPQSTTFSLTTELGMCCGGQMTIYFETIRENPPLIILGAGHIGSAVCQLASRTGFEVAVADPRSELLSSELLGESAALIDGYEDEDLNRLPFGPDAFVLVVTHDHPTDQRLVEAVLKRQFRYLAMIGSKRKAQLAFERCRNKGISESQIEQIHSPAGIDIGAETPEEIAVSILAEMIQYRRQKDAASSSSSTT